MLLLVAMSACKDEDNQVGGSLQRQDLVFTDTIDAIQVFSIAEDSIRTSKMSSEIFGWVDDPVFGTVRSDLYIQFRLSAVSVDFGEGAELDSVVLSLPYSGFFGDTGYRLQVGVYELDEPMHKDSAYYSTRDLKTTGGNLSSAGWLDVHPLRKVTVTGEEQSAQLRIPLDKNYFIQKIMQKSGASELSDNQHFLPYFKGLKLKVEGKEGKGCLGYFSLQHALACVTLHYHNNSHDSLVFQLVSNDSSIYYARISHNGYAEAEAELKRQLVDKDYSAAGRAFYLQAGGGVKAQMRFPSLKSRFEGRRVVVHKAELLLYRDGAVDGDPYFPPASLSMYYRQDSASSKSFFLPDYLNLGSDYFGGAYSKEDSSYRFLLTEYVQYVLMDKLSVDYPLYLTVNGAATQATRVRIKGPSNPDRGRRMRLLLTCSEAEGTYAGKKE